MSVPATGRALKDFPREKVIITTKWGLVVTPAREYINIGTREFLRETVDQSLKRLGTDYIDILILRSPDPNVPLADTMQYMKVRLASQQDHCSAAAEIGPISNRHLSKSRRPPSDPASEPLF